MVEKTKQDGVILLVTTPGFPYLKGGANTITRTLLNEINSHRKACVFVQGEWEHREMHSNRYNDASVYTMRLLLPHISRNLLRNTARFLIDLPHILIRLRRLLREERISIIGLQMLVPQHIYFWLLHIFGGPPYLISLRGSDVTRFDHWPRFDRWLMRRILKNAELVTTNSHWLAEQVRSTWREGVDFKRLRIVYNGLSQGGVDEFTFDEGQPATNVASIIQGNYFSCVSSFDHYKGHDLLIEAWKTFIATHPDWKLVLVGDGPDYDDRYRQADQSGIAGSIIFAGQRSNRETLQIIAASKGLVLPSRSEAFGNVLVEAALVGVPSIACAVGGVPEIIDHEKNGLLVPPEQSQAIADAMTRLATDGVLRTKLAFAAKEKARSCFTAEKMTDSYLSAVDEALQHSQPAL